MRAKTFILLFVAVALSGCYIDDDDDEEAGPQAPVITSFSFSGPHGVVEGQPVTFKVTATGTEPLSYQWLRNGQKIDGATSATLTFAAALSSEKTFYRVAVTNVASFAVTSDVQLFVVPAHPRPPAFGDLRFQQIAAPGILIEGYVADVFALGPRTLLAGADLFRQVPTPLFVQDSCAGDPCGWQVPLLIPLQGVVATTTRYRASDRFDTLEADIAATVQAKEVITSIDLRPDKDSYALASTTQTVGLAFDLKSLTVDAAGVAAAVQAEGAASRVVTAIGVQAGGVRVFSYGWQGDGTTVYDTSVAQASVDGVADAASQLAAGGYLITAFGGDGAGGVFLVGTKVQGETEARPLRIVTGQSQIDPPGQDLVRAFAQGFATVGIAGGSSMTWIGEQ